MKSALIAIGSLALGASALFLLDSARLRRNRDRDRSLPLAYSGPGSARPTFARTGRPTEPGEVEEFLGNQGTTPSGS